MSEKSLSRFKDRVRDLTRRVYRVSPAILMKGLKEYVGGWAGYYARFAGCEASLRSLDGWMRRRIRQWFWVQWKTTGNRRSHLLQGGASLAGASQACYIRSPWRASNHHAVHVCLSNQRIERAGLLPLVKHLQRRAPS